MRITKGLYQDRRQGKDPFGWRAASLEGQLAGGGLWGRGRTELDDRGRQSV